MGTSKGAFIQSRFTASRISSESPNQTASNNKDKLKGSNALVDQIHEAKRTKIIEAGGWPTQVPLDPSKFYEKLGAIPHPRTRLPVTALAPYQIDISKAILKNKYTIVVKSQKSGITTSALMTDFQLSILPPSNPHSCMGREILIVAQSADMARQHLDTLRQMIGASETYSEYLITSPIPGIPEDYVSKVEKLYIYNPFDPARPTKIIGRGPKARQLWSWKDVKHIHMSDIAVVDQLHDDTIDSALSRLANSDGTVIIETPPNGPSGPIYEIWNKSRTKSESDTPIGQFNPIKVTWRHAVDAGVMSEEKIMEYKQIYGSEFPRYFEAEFIAGGGNMFDPADIDRAEKMGREMMMMMMTLEDFVVPEAAKSMGIDPGFGSSKFAIVVTQANNGRAEVIYADEFKNSTPTMMLEQAAQIAQRYYVGTVFIDGWNSGWIRDLKAMLDDNPEEWEHQLREIKKNFKDDDFQTYLKRLITQNVRVIPINFGEKGRGGKEMLAHAQAMVERGLLAIPPQFQGLLAQMRSATESNRDLSKSSHHPLDMIDALRLNLIYYTLPKQTV